ncbi:FMN-dependent NADH-azoreductase [Phaeacidiphilus oryzae]|jgi:FMN-dependent NADH-azoreductase|uniref:FMN-dependent NADH-azoreductase n=1 Tax=Phaeacidiphilus oryzae TaxID=348818 RepID=UPI00056920A0|nr:NAD(P)H-dependent oxidoreductase [Phaeacidiphilus oryzae]
MATLLQIDSSLYPLGGSSSREVTDIFRNEWLAAHPEGKVIHRDLAAQPLPHLDVHGALAGFSAPDQHTPEQAAAFALRDELARELESADVVLVGAPMYNFTIPSTLKAWLDQVIIMGRTSGPESTLKGKKAVIVASRGGSYAPGTPRESFEYVQNYLGAVFTGMFGMEVEYILPELTLARSNPAMADLVDKADAAKAKAHSDARELAKKLATASA